MAFRFNDCGCCLNPKEAINIAENTGLITIYVAEKHGLWAHGVTMDGGYGHSACFSQYRTSHKTEHDAIEAAIDAIYAYLNRINQPARLLTSGWHNTDLSKPVYFNALKFEIMLELKETNHPYLCETANYYESQHTNWESWAHFAAAFAESDIDYNRVHRYDLVKHDNGCFVLELYMIFQRKGLASSSYVRNITEFDLPEINSYLRKHYEQQQKLWTEFA